MQPNRCPSGQPLSRVQLFATPWTAAYQASLSIYQPPELAQTHVHRVGDAIQPSHRLCPLLLLHSIFSRLFSNESVLRIRWPKYWSFSFSISPSSEYSGLISFRMDWMDLLAVHGTLKSLLQHHSSKASVLRHSAFFMVQPSLTSIHDYWKNYSFHYTDGKVMSLLFNMLSRLVTAFLPRSKHLLISCLQSPSTSDLGA